MIQANELRMGNWVMDEFGRYGEICHIREQSLKYQIPGASNPPFNQNLSEISPIPLTEEILLKAAFVKDLEKSHILYGSYDHKDYDFRVEVHNGEWQFCIDKGSKNIIILALHQLQNLYFALTQKELEINL